MMPLTNTPMPCLDEPAFEAAIDLTRGPRYRKAVAVAKAICAECPLQARCAAAAGTEPGVWGGLTAEERRKPPVTRQYCGRRSGAQVHRRRGEHTCKACREEEARYVREKSKRAKKEAA